jgi:parallel beta-helix repeat protein
VGPASDGFGTGFGLSVRGSERVTIEAVEIRGFFRGLVVSDSSDLVVRGNNIHSLRMDGMNFAQVERVLIEGNHIHDFIRSLASRDHADMIQFWTNGTTVASRDIVIRNNVLNSGNGWYTQSIFMRNDQVDRGLAGDEMFYRNILIEENVIINAHLHGIVVGATDGLIIRNNTVIRNARSEGERDNVAQWNPRISVAEPSRNVQILRNVVSRIAGDEAQAGWVIADNLFIQDRGRLGEGLYYDLVFVAARTGDPQNLGSFSYLPGGPLEGAGIGASRLATLQPTVPGVPGE